MLFEDDFLELIVPVSFQKNEYFKKREFTYPFLYFLNSL